MKYFLILIIGLIGCQLQAKHYYVDPASGSDSNPGSSQAPWQTMRFALGAESPLVGGDILQLKPGIYKEDSIRIHVRGINKFIKVRGGAGVIFDGTDEALSVEGSWELVDPIKQIYVYKDDIDQQGALSKFFFRGFFDYRGERNSLIPYKESKNFFSDYQETRWPNPATAPSDETIGVRHYVGPGTYYDPHEQKLYLRMLLPSPQVVPPDRTLPQLTEFDLSEVDLFIAKPQQDNTFGFDVSGDLFIKFEDIDFFNFQLPIFNIAHKSHNIINEVKFQNCKFENNSMCLITSHVSNILVQQCKFKQHIPDWISFNDGKGGVKVVDTTDVGHDTLLLINPASTVTGDALFFGNKSRNITVRYCTFEDMWDCVQFSNGAHEEKLDKYPKACKVHNCIFKEVMDDAVEINNDAMDIDVYENQFLEVTFGLSISGQRNTEFEEISNLYHKGKIFYHHNIVDAVPKFGTRANPNNDTLRFRINSPFLGSHNVGINTKCVFKMYHNTFRVRNGYKNRWVDPRNNRFLPNLLGSDSIAQMGIDSIEIPEKAMEIYNNIFIHENFNFMLDIKMRLYSGREIWNGNVYHRILPEGSVPYQDFDETRPFWRTKFPRTGGGEITKDYESLIAFAGDTDYYSQTKFLGKKFEEDGEILDVLDLSASFRIYDNNPAATGAIDLTSTGWYGTDTYQEYRGAKPPLTATSREFKIVNTIDQVNVKDQVYPNPFMHQLQIVVNQKEEGPISIQLFNLDGKFISTVYKHPNLNEGHKTINWNASKIPAGAYFLRIGKTSGIETIKLMKSE